MPTFNIWRGDAQGIAQDDYLTPANVEIGDTFTVTINRKDYSYTVPDDATSHATLGYVPFICYAMAAGLTTLGAYDAEFGEITWTALDTTDDGEYDVIRARGPSDGKPFTVTTSTGDAGNLSVDVVEVTKGDGGLNEVQRVTIAGTATGGTFTLTFDGQTTGTIAYNAAAATVEAAIEALSNVDDVDVTGSAGGPWDVEFKGDYLNVDAPSLTGDGTNIIKAASGYSVRVLTIQAAVAGRNEIQRVSIPSTASGGTFTLGFDGATTAATAYNASAATLKTNLEALATIDTVTVTEATAGVWDVEFTGSLAETDATKLVGDGSSLTGVASMTIATTQEGAPGYNAIVSITTARATVGLVWKNETQTEYGRAFTVNRSNTVAEIQGQVDSRLVSMTNASPGDVVVSRNGDTWTFETTGTFARRPAGRYFPAGGNLDFYNSWSVDDYLLLVQNGSTDGIDEIQTVTINNNPTGGTFTLTFESQTTAGIAYNADAAAVESALEALSNLTADEVSVTKVGATYWVTFALARDCARMTADASSLTGGSVSVTTSQTAIATINEKQEVTINGNPLGGTFTLTFDGQTTGNVAYDASASTLDTALEALSNIAAGDVAVTGAAGGPWTVEFIQNFAGTNVPSMTGSGALLSGATILVSTTQDATDPTNEVQTIALGGSPTGGTFTLTFDSQTTTDIQYNCSADTLKVYLEALSSVDVGELDITGDDGGPWTITFQAGLGGTDVDAITGDATNLTTSGTQTLTRSSVTTPTGPNWFDEAENWSAGTAPADDETLVFENSEANCLYGLSNATVTPEKVIVKGSYTGQIGLPVHTGSYYEYRDTELRLGTDGDGAASTVIVEIGEGDGGGSGLIRLNTGDKQTQLIVYNTAASADGDTPSICWRGTHVSNTVDVLKGHVGIGYFKNQPATVTTLRCSYIDAKETDVTLVVGSDVTLTTLLKNGGAAVIYCAASTVEHHAGDLEAYGSGDITTLIASGGNVYSATDGVIGNYGTITGITAADPAVVTSTAHGLSAGDKVRIAGVVGMTEVNQNEYTVGETAADTFQLLDTDSSAYTAYSSAGTWGKVGSLVVANDAVLDFSRSLKAREAAVAIDVYGSEAIVKDDAKRMTTKTYLSGEFALHFHYTTRDENIGSDFIQVRRAS